MTSWKNPDESYADFSMEDYLTQGVLPAIEAATSITGSPDVNVVGYCIGGTLLSIALAALRAKGDTRLHATTFFVSLQDFEEPGDLGVFVDEKQLIDLDKRMARRGFLESDDMAATMNLLRSNDLIWHYVVNNYLLGKEPMAFDLLYWNSDGTRMPRKTHLYYLRNMYLENNLVRPGKLEFLCEKIDLGKIDQDVYAVGTLEDHIVPWRSAFKIRRNVAGSVRFILANSGHIAGIISPPGGKNSYFTNESPSTDPEQWLEGATQRQGSWWEDWLTWLSPRSGEQVNPPTMGNSLFRPLTSAPGTYVREMGGEAKYPAMDLAVESE
jgi:polyhydroxyalkanoate synthase